MNTEKIIKLIEKNIEDLESIKLEILGKETSNKKEKKVKEKEILELLKIRAFPTEEDFIKDIKKVLSRKNISKEMLEDVLEAVYKANTKSPKEDIKKYIFSCLYNSKKS